MLSPLPLVTKSGYHLPGDGPQVLFFHGLTGSPYDLRPLAQSLNQRGFQVSVPLLKGHGTKISDLDSVTADDWLKQAQDCLSQLDQNRSIILGGLSMGALLALVLSKKSQKKIDSLLLLSCALRLELSAELTISLAHIGLLPKNSHFKKLSGGSDIADPEAKKKCPSYREMSLFGMMQLDDLRLQALNALPKILSPMFVAFGEQDSAIDTRGSWQLLLEKSNTSLFCKFYSRSKHIVSLDFDRDKLCDDVIRFLNQKIGNPS
ncbi:MAG: alpha/beta fold hydrolase [Myxococcales bacterium]|nr:alpha/beta fold hydrolase [Myxococcales bacterium]USN51712.1 MAG: alpha/beta fold hydrolase [Myxococcales bacterium]